MALESHEIILVKYIVGNVRIREEIWGRTFSWTVLLMKLSFCSLNFIIFSLWFEKAGTFYYHICFIAEAFFAQFWNFLNFVIISALKLFQYLLRKNVRVYIIPQCCSDRHALHKHDTLLNRFTHEIHATQLKETIILHEYWDYKSILLINFLRSQNSNTELPYFF